MGDLWDRYLDDVASLRKTDAATLRASLENLDAEITARDGDLAKLALDFKLVDELKTRDELRQLHDRGRREGRGRGRPSARSTSRRYARLAEARDLDLGKTEIAVVVAEGEIVDGEQPPGLIGGDSTAKLIRKAREDEDVKAIVLRVDSPGGGVFPSESHPARGRADEEGRQAGRRVDGRRRGLGRLLDLDERRRDHRDPEHDHGSIGIFGLWFNVPQAMGKLGLQHRRRRARRWISGAIDPTRAYDPRLGTVIQSVIDRGYQQFIGNVADARGKSAGEVDADRARPRVERRRRRRSAASSTRSAPSRTRSRRPRSARSSTDYRVRYVEKELSAFERFMLDMSELAPRRDARTSDSARGRVVPAATSASTSSSGCKRMVQDAMKQRPAAIYAHCECGI